MVEHAAVNRGVAGSSPARGAFNAAEIRFCRIMFYVFQTFLIQEIPGRFCSTLNAAGSDKRLRGQEVKTSPFHGGNTGSIPVGVISLPVRQCENGSLAQLVRATGS